MKFKKVTGERVERTFFKNCLTKQCDHKDRLDVLTLRRIIFLSRCLVFFLFSEESTSNLTILDVFMVYISGRDHNIILRFVLKN